MSRRNRRYTLEEASAICLKAGFELLEISYTNARTSMRVRCLDDRHITYKRLDSVLRGQGCGSCLEFSKGNLELAREDFVKRGWTLDEKEYRGSKCPMACRCPVGHPVAKSWDSIRDSRYGGNRCNTCRIEPKKSDAAYLVALADGVPVYKEIGDLPSDSGVYQITCTSNNLFYIGSTTRGFRYRLQTHLNKLRDGRHGNVVLQRCFDKHGESSFVFQILELVDPGLCLEREQYYIDILKPTINIRLVACDSQLGVKRSAENILRLSLINSKSYTLRSPDGTIYEVTGLRPFCRTRELSEGCMYMVVNGRLKQHKGWTAKHYDGNTAGL